MNELDTAWQRELDRRSRVYEDIDAGDRWEGQLTRLDYTAVALLTIVLVCGFWIWGN